MTSPVISFPGPAGPPGNPNTPRGDYDPTVQYALDNTVFYENGTYLVVAPVPAAGVPPLEDDGTTLHAGWALFLKPVDPAGTASSLVSTEATQRASADTVIAGEITTNATTAASYTDTKIAAEVTRSNGAYDASGAAVTAQTTAVGAAAGLAIVFGV